MKTATQNKRGQSVLEVIVAMAIFSLISAAMITMVTGSFVGLTQGGEQTQAEALAQEGIEAVKAIYDEAWNGLTYATSSVSVTGSKWIFDGESTTETIGQFTRTISFNNVCRNASNSIAACPGNYTDVHTKELSSVVTWDTRNGVSNTVERISYITNWDSRDWTQTDWSGGSGQSIWSDTSLYNTDDGNLATSMTGQVMLVSANIEDGGFGLPVGTTVDWPFTTSANYTFNSSDIEVTAGSAQLISSGGASALGATINDNFSSNATGWAFSMWDAGGGEVDPTGIWVSLGGNPSGHINIDIPSNASNDEVGGYWEQSISITENGANVTCGFDWSVTQWVASKGVDDYQVYVFLDSTTGEPTIGSEIWSSGTQNGVTSWSSQSVDCSSAATTSGMYYYKIAVWLDSTNKATGPITLGYDNAKVEWSKISGGSFPTDEPAIYPTTSQSVPGVTSWNSFVETASKDGGEIYYQLTNDNGATWKYWNGSSWATAGAADYSTASVVNTNIGSFSVANEQIKFKAFLESNGTQDVQLDNISVAFSAPVAAWSFTSWDVDGGEVTPTGSVYANGGNPSGYVDVSVPRGGGDEVGGYWEQAFTTYTNNPTPLTVDFDYKVFDFNDSPTVADIRIYIDNVSGNPSTQVGSSISTSAESSWASAPKIDASSAVTTAGVYYIKLAYWVETPAGGGSNASGPFVIGLDNVVLDLGNGEYKTSGTLTSSAFDMSNASPVQIIEWDETIPSVAETVKFEISTAPNSGGSPGTWSSWYGSSGAGTFFTNATGTLISTDLNNNQWVRYRATLGGGGSDTPVLQEVRVNYK